MPRRFTDTEKWRDEWWGSLPNDYRMIWLYLVDSCSIAGIWKKDFRGLNFNCNTKITEDEFLKVFGTRVIDKGNFFFIPKFLRYQCPKGLNSNKPAILSIIKELELNDLTKIVNESLGNDFLIIKDKGKGKDKGTGIGEGKDTPPETPKPPAPEEYQVPFKVGTPVHNAWIEWEQFRKEKKQKLVASTVKKQIQFLGGRADPEIVAILNQSITNGWTGLFELKKQTNGTNNGGYSKSTIRRADAVIEERKDYGEF